MFTTGLFFWCISELSNLDVFDFYDWRYFFCLSVSDSDHFLSMYTSEVFLSLIVIIFCPCMLLRCIKVHLTKPLCTGDAPRIYGLHLTCAKPRKVTCTCMSVSLSCCPSVSILNLESRINFSIIQQLAREFLI
jgi:hypothetical protein